MVHKLISVLGIRERTVLEYINSAIAWGVLEISGGDIRYIKTYKTKNNGHKTETKELKEKTDDEILQNRRKYDNKKDI